MFIFSVELFNWMLEKLRAWDFHRKVMRSFIWPDDSSYPSTSNLRQRIPPSHSNFKHRSEFILNYISSPVLFPNFNLNFAACLFNLHFQVKIWIFDFDNFWMNCWNNSTENHCLIEDVWNYVTTNYYFLYSKV